MKHLLSLLTVVSLLAVATACGDGSCTDNANSLPLVRFYQSQGGLVTVSGVSLRGMGAPGDSVLVSNASISEAYLPLRATTNSTQWIIDIATTDGGSVADTISLQYTTSPYFASEECGAMFKFDITQASCTHNVIDSVVITQPSVTNVSRETLRIYFKKQ